MTDNPKQILREKMRALRARIDPQLRRAWNETIQNALLETERWKKARTVLAYRSMPEETATGRVLAAALAQGKRLALPRCVEGEKRFEPVQVHDLENDLAPGKFADLEEPLATLPAWNGGPFDLAIVPGVAFDRKGHRLGFGGGMYDRFLANHPRTWRLALAYDLQLIDRVPADPHDKPVHALLTEDSLTVFEANPGTTE